MFSHDSRNAQLFVAINYLTIAIIDGCAAMNNANFIYITLRQLFHSDGVAIGLLSSTTASRFCSSATAWPAPKGLLFHFSSLFSFDTDQICAFTWPFPENGRCARFSSPYRSHISGDILLSQEILLLNNLATSSIFAALSFRRAGAAM